MRSRPLKRADPLREQVYETLHGMLARGDIDPASRLTETRLAAMLGVSRTPVREALARLAQEGLVRGSARGKSLARLARGDVDEILELRSLLEPFIAARAAERASPEGLARLRAAFDREVEAAPQRAADRFSAANHEFRTVLLELCGNSRLAETARRLDGQLQVLRRATLAERANREVVVRHHRRLLAALARRDARAAEQAIRDLMSLAWEEAAAMAGEPAVAAA